MCIRDSPKADWFSEKAGSQWEVFLKGNAERSQYRYGGSVMAEGMRFSFPSLLFYEGRTYGQPEVCLLYTSYGLRCKGYYDTNITGVFDTATQSQIVKLQQDAGLSEDVYKRQELHRECY